MSALVSIIMPAYNVENYIGKSIESIIGQEYNNWELIVVNDGSTDNTCDVVQAFTRTDSRIKLYNQDNRGVSVARNRGINVATGEYLAFLDGDDLWDKRFLAEVVAAKETNNVEMAYSGYNAFYEDGRSRAFKFQYMDGDILVAYLNEIVSMHIGSLVVDKSMLNEFNIRFTEGCAIGEDVEFIIKLLCVAKVFSIRKELMLYRMRRPGSATNSTFKWQAHINGIRSFERIKVFILERCSEVANCEEILNILDNKTGKYRYWLLWKMVKFGYHTEALQMLSDSECIQELNKIKTFNLSFKQRLRYHAILSKNRYVWNCCGMFKAR